MKIFFKISIILFFAGILLFLLIPSPIKPAKYIVSKINNLKNVENIKLIPDAKPVAQNKIESSEDILVDKNEVIYFANGQEITKISPDEKMEVFAHTGGQNLGMAFDNEGNIIVANNSKGVLKINNKGKVETLVPANYPNGVAVSKDGTIYYSDSSSKYYGTKKSYFLDYLEARPYGKLFSFNPKTRELKTLLTDLRYANGVALSKNEDFLLVNETYGYKITKYYIKGAKAGTKEVFKDSLYGYPDGISSDDKGDFYVAIYAPRKPFLDLIHKYPFLKAQLAKLPQSMLPKPDKNSSILVIDENGKVLKKYYDNTGNIFSLSSVKRYDRTLYIGTLVGKSIWKYEFK